MARPVVLVYQEVASVTVTTDVPDLNCLIVGPCYHIQDYLDDKADIQAATDYGTKDSDNTYIPPQVATDAVTISEPPNNSTGALLDSTSVQIYFDNCRVLMGEDVTTGAIVATAGIPHNIIDCSGADASFITDMADMQAGDYVIIQDPNNPGVDPDLVKRILSVDTTGAAEKIYTTTNFAAGNAAAVDLRVEREVDDVAVDSSFVTVTGNQIVIAGGVTTTLTGESSPRTVQYAEVYVEYMSLRQDLRDVDTVSSETDITTKVGTVDSRNPLAGALKVAIANTTTPVQFFGVKSDDSTGHNDCMEIIEGRTDIYAIVPLTESSSLLASWKTEVEGLASVSNAETNGIPQKFRVILGTQALPTTSVESGPYTDGGHYEVTGAINNTPIQAADDINVFVDENATFVTDDVRANDTLVITNAAGSAETNVGTYTVAEVYGETRLRTTTAFASAALDLANTYYYIIRSTGTPVSGTSFTGGDCTAATNQYSLDGTASMNGIAGLASYAGKVLRLTAPAGNAGDWLVLSCTVATPGVCTVDHPTKTLALDTSGTAGQLFDTISSGLNVTTTQRRCYRVIKSPSATFTTDLVKATDLLEVPNPITGTDYTTNTPYSYTVAYIPNENDIVLAANEDVIAQDVSEGDTDLNFRISRTLSKDDQVDELVLIAQSFDSNRVVLVWPDEVTVTDLVDGSKTRSVASTPEDADPQPGYYLAAVVGAMTAGLPSHQGFTNLGIAGVDQIDNSTRYFSDTQLTELSDGGWFVFAQATTNTLPYCIHQLTTDPSTLETGEYSMVKNFDFVSLYFQDTLDDFLGEYNVNEENLSLLESALDDSIGTLKLRKYAKIGAPINSAEVSSVAVSDSSDDRVEIYVDVDFPAPLNRIGLHIVSS